MGEKIARIERGNQKLKTLYLMDILLSETDSGEMHGLTVSDMITRLESYEILAERKSIYKDIDLLREYGLDIEKVQRDRTTYYHVMSREFEIAELKLLVDAVQSAKFLTEKKTDALIRKIVKMCSTYQASELKRHVRVSGKAKTENAKFFYSLDAIHDAIAHNFRISFQYFNWNEKKEKHLHHDGDFYDVSPWELLQDDENYYLIGYDEKAGKIKHYRVDKMLQVKQINEKRNGEAAFKAVHAENYASSVFGMYGGREEIVTLECENSMANIIIDRFGKDNTFFPKGEGKFEVKVKVNVSDQFFGWVISLGRDIKVTGPQYVVEDMQALVKRLVEQYHP